jgi:AcrR family transcriptional regulator
VSNGALRLTAMTTPAQNHAASAAAPTSSSLTGAPARPSSVAAAPAACSPNRRKILAGAREVFMGSGFDRASVEAIAARAGVAKATVYNHFHDKAQLFVASFSEEADQLRGDLLACLSAEAEGDVDDALRRAGEAVVAAILTPAFVSLYRQTSAEIARFPEIGRILFDRGPAVVLERIADFLRRWVARGDLRIDDIPMAAMQLNTLWQGNLFFRAQMGVLDPVPDATIREVVRHGVRVFLSAYRA